MLLSAVTPIRSAVARFLPQVNVLTHSSQLPSTKYTISARQHCIHRFCTTTATVEMTKKGLVLGVYGEGKKDSGTVFTPAAEAFNKRTGGKLKTLLDSVGENMKTGSTRLFYGLDDEYRAVAVTALGKQSPGFNAAEQRDDAKENVRIASSAGVKCLRDVGCTQAEIDPCGDPQAASEGVHMGLYVFDKLKAESSRKKPVDVSEHGTDTSSTEWVKGSVVCEGQNFARDLMEMPANLMTPTIFANTVSDSLNKVSSKVQCHIRDKVWAESMKMYSYLSVSKGSEEPPAFLEIHYNGAGDSGKKPLLLVGKGITFDSGGISIKPSANMDLMRGDMGGAACVAGTLYTIAKLNLPINVVGLMPLSENLPSGKASKPGDVVCAMNGKSIQIDNTDAEGRLVLADALCYADTFQPRAVIDLATLTGACVIALGNAATAVYTHSPTLWEQLYTAGTVTGDRMWRMPLWNHYSKQMKKSHLADLNNIGGGRSGGSCTAAAFLKEFTECPEWVHMDIAGVMDGADEIPYLVKGMTGRPTRTLVEFISTLAQQDSSV